jgi:4-carboxymuconolactone decarboxylase
MVETVKATWVPWANEAGFQVATADGRLIGPFNALLLRPEVAAKFWELGAAVANHTTLSPREREVVAIAVGAVWGADYELYSHCALARNAGLSDNAVTTLASGGIPDDLNDREIIAARLAHQLSTGHRIDDELYRAAESAFGATGLLDIAALMGQFHVVCTMLTLFAVPAPNEVTC